MKSSALVHTRRRAAACSALGVTSGRVISAHPMTLEKAFAAVASTLIVLTIAALAALLVLQTELHGITTGLGNALESVRIAKQLRV